MITLRTARTPGRTASLSAGIPGGLCPQPFAAPQGSGCHTRREAAQGSRATAAHGRPDASAAPRRSSPPRDPAAACTARSSLPARSGWPPVPPAPALCTAPGAEATRCPEMRIPEAVTTPLMPQKPPCSRCQMPGPMVSCQPRRKRNPTWWKFCEPPGLRYQHVARPIAAPAPPWVNRRPMPPAARVYGQVERLRCRI